MSSTQKKLLRLYDTINKFEAIDKTNVSIYLIVRMGTLLIIIFSEDGGQWPSVNLI